MYYAELAAAIAEFIKERDQNLALADIAHAVHAAVGAKVFERVRPFQQALSDEDIGKLLDTHAGQYVTAREALQAAGRSGAPHGDVISAGRQLSKLFVVRKVGQIATYKIERVAVIA